MFAYCLKCRKKTETKIPKVAGRKNERIMLLSKFAVCNGEKTQFIKEHKVGGLLSSLEIKTPLSEIYLVGALLF